jgi:hypothetical protein
MTALARLGVVNAFTCWILRTRGLRRLADHQVVELRFQGTRTGRWIRLPVMYAQSDNRLVVLVGGPAAKKWWRNFRRPHPVDLLLRGTLRHGVGHVAEGPHERSEAAAIYAARYPDLPAGGDPLVVIALDGEEAVRP